MAPLGKLIRQRMNELDLTYDEVARRGELPKATVYMLATKSEHRQAPRAETLRKLASGLSLSLQTVQSAAALSAGLIPLDPVPVDQETITDVVDVMLRMSADQRGTLKSLAVALLAH